MHETASKFLFDHNSQSNLKFEEPISFSPFNTRFSQNNFDLFINKFGQSNHDDNSFFNLKSMNSVKNFSSFSLDKNPKSRFEESVKSILTLKETPTTVSNKCTPTDNKSKNIIIQASESSSQKKKRGKKKAHEKDGNDEDEKHSRILKHPITKLRKSRQTKKKSENDEIDQNSIFLRLYPGDLITKQLMMKLNNFPRLEIKTSKNTYLKKVADHLREKWLSKVNNEKEHKFGLILKPNPSCWLRDLTNKISSNLNLPEEVAPLPETYMLSDIWSGYNEPDSNKIDLFYEIIEIQIENNIQTPKSRKQGGRQETIQRRPTGYFGGGSVTQSKDDSPVPHNLSKSNKDENIISDRLPDKFGPYSGADYFEGVRRSASMSRMSEKNSNEGKSNGSSGFSFNETANRDTNSKGGHIPTSNDQSLKILYSQLNQQFPDESKFTSKLLPSGQSMNSSGPIKLIPVKRKI